MTGEQEQRPTICAVHSGTELQRWYWLKTELIDLARARGVSPGGGKRDLTARLAAHLDGKPLPPPARRATAPGDGGDTRLADHARPAGKQLAGTLTTDTIIPAGQRSSQALRTFFTETIGPSFRFDGPMRDFIANGAGRTLGDAVDHWHATRNRPRGEIAPQFELNRFTRAWHEAHPGGTHAQAIEAWQRHRALPRDAHVD